jgi:hypothetical protein
MVTRRLIASQIMVLVIAVDIAIGLGRLLLAHIRTLPGLAVLVAIGDGLADRRPRLHGGRNVLIGLRRVLESLRERSPCCEYRLILPRLPCGPCLQDVVVNRQTQEICCGLGVHAFATLADAFDISILGYVRI